jgi:hypothetical protein
MALISFGYRVNMYAPSLLPTDPGGYIVAYDLDGVLKQKNYQGVVTLVGSGAGGPQGPPGPVGPAGLTWSGYWVATQSYSINYAVGYASASWWCILGVTGATGNDSPDIDTTHWTLLAAQGSPGSQGAQGEHGLDGPQGLTGATGPTGATGAGVTSSFYLQGTTDYSYDTSSDIYRTGSLVIGTSASSTSKLYVYATQSGALRLVDGTEGNGYILTSDTNGVATWTPLSSIGISGASGSIPKFTGTSSLGNSRFYEIGTVGYYGSGSSYVSFLTGGNTWLTLNRSQSSMDFILGNPQSPTFQVGQIQSTNTIGLSVESAGYTSFNTGPTYLEKMRITSDGNVGIGLTAPSTTLHVYATQSGAFRLEDGTQGNNYILTSDSNGVATWTASIYATDSNVVHKTGNENIDGIKTFTGSATTKIVLDTVNGQGIFGGVGSLSSGTNFYSQNQGTGIGAYFDTSSTGRAVWITSGASSSGRVLDISAGGSGDAVSISSSGSARLIVGMSGSNVNFTLNKGGEIYTAGVVSIGTSGASASLHIRGTSSVSGNSLLVENSSNTQLLKVLNNGQIILGDSNSAAAPASSVQGVFIIGPGNSNYGSNTSNPNLLTFIVGSTDPTFVSGIQGASANHGNVRSGIYFTNNASDIVFRTGPTTATLPEIMRIGVEGNVNINSATAMSGSKLFIQSSTSSTTIGSNVMLDLYNGDAGTFDSISEIAFSQNGQPGASQPYNVGHRYALITGYAITGNNSTSIGGIKFSTRATTGVGLVTSLVIDQNGSVYNQSRGISNTIYGYQALLSATASLNNIAFGYQALYSNTANDNVAIGYTSLYSNTTGDANTAIGFQSLKLNTTGEANTAIGWNSLLSNTTGSYNTSIGLQSLVYNTTSISAISITNGGSGYTMSSTFSNVQLSYISGSTATTYPIVTIYVGAGGTVSTATLVTNGTGFKDATTVMGANLGTGVTFSVSVSTLNSGDNNVAVGYNSLYSNTTGNNNTAIGVESLYLNTIGENNTAFGYLAGSLISGTTSGTTQSNNSVFIGYDTRPQADGQTNQIVVGYGATGNGSNSVTLGNNSVTRTYLKGSVVIADGTQGDGYILTSDTNGVASWASTVVVITTTSSITTNTLDNNGLSQINKCVIIDNGTYSINLTVDTTSGFTSTYLKHGTASISFVQGSGRTLVQVDGTLVLNGAVGSSATIISYSTTDYLRVNNA